MQRKDSGRGYVVAVAQVSGDSSILNLLCAKDQANENCEHRSQIFQQVMKRIPLHVFPLIFPPVLQLLSSSIPLLTKYWAGHHLSISESCA